MSIMSTEEYEAKKAAREAAYAERRAAQQREFEAAYVRRVEAFKEQLNSPEFRYSRFRPNLGVTIYLYDPKSPTGVHAGATINFEDAVPLMDENGRPFPLSPTEGLNKSGANVGY